MYSAEIRPVLTKALCWNVDNKQSPLHYIALLFIFFSYCLDVNNQGRCFENDLKMKVDQG
jgi:hypothetical protein